MVSGFLTSPYDQARIISGEASPILIESKCSTGACCLKSLSKSLMLLPSILLELDVDTERTDFFDEDVEGFRHSGIHLVMTVDDVLVHLRAAVHVIRLDGEHFLQRVRGAIRLERPHFHLTEALTTELRLAAQRLLGDQGVRSGRTRMHLVVDQVVELQHVHVADGDVALEALAGAAVEQVRLTTGG